MSARASQQIYMEWVDGDEEPAGDSLEHIYAGSRKTEDGKRGRSPYKKCRDVPQQPPYPCGCGKSLFTKPLNARLRSCAPISARLMSVHANQRINWERTWLTPASEGDRRHLYGQGKVQAKDSSGGGAMWYQGEISEADQFNKVNVESRVMYEGTVTGTDMSRATDAREKGRIGILGSSLSYAGSYGRVTSQPIGRDINPLGRGDGMAYVGGAFSLGRIAPRLPIGHVRGGSGNSVNNCGCKACGDPYVKSDPNPRPITNPNNPSDHKPSFDYPDECQYCWDVFNEELDTCNEIYDIDLKRAQDYFDSTVMWPMNALIAANISCSVLVGVITSTAIGSGVGSALWCAAVATALACYETWWDAWVRIEECNEQLRYDEREAEIALDECRLKACKRWAKCLTEEDCPETWDRKVDCSSYKIRPKYVKKTFFPIPTPSWWPNMTRDVSIFMTMCGLYYIIKGNFKILPSKPSSVPTSRTQNQIVTNNSSFQ